MNLLGSNFPEFYTGVENKREHWVRIGYSGVYFAFTFILISYMSHAWSTSNAWDFGYRPTFSYDGMQNLQGTVGWTVTRVAWVYLAPPLWGMAVAVIGMSCFNFFEGSRSHLRTIFYWVGFNGYLLYLSYVATALLSGVNFSSKFFSGFAGFYAWLEWSNPKIMSLLVVQMIISLPIGLLFSKGLLQLNHSRQLAAKRNGKQLIFLQTFLLPVVAGMLLVTTATFPMDYKYQLIRFGTIPLLGIVTFLGMNLHKAKHISIVKGGLRPVPTIGLAAMVLVLLLSRFGLELTVKPLW